MPTEIATRRSPKRAFKEFLVRQLIKDSGHYRQRFPNDIARLKAELRPGDVLLVEGCQRVSEVIKYLTQSSWSHAALYVGDAMLKRSPDSAEQERQRHGEDASALLVEANMEEGVCTAALSKYEYRQHSNMPTVQAACRRYSNRDQYCGRPDG